MHHNACENIPLESAGIPSPISASGSEATKCLAATDQPTVQAEFAFPEVASLEVPKISAPIPEAIADPKEPSIPPVVGEPEVASTPLPETGGRSAASHHAPSRQIRPRSTVAKAGGCGRTKSSSTGHSTRQRGTSRAGRIRSAPAAKTGAGTGTSSTTAPQPQLAAADSPQLGRPKTRRTSRSYATVQRLRREQKRIDVYLSIEAHEAAKSLARSRSLSLAGLVRSLLAAAAG